MKLLVAIAAVLLGVSACGTPGAGQLAPSGDLQTNAVRPFTNSVVVTAVYGQMPIAHLEILLKKNGWNDGIILTRGKTGLKGRVRLSATWRKDEIICVGGTYVRGNQTTHAHLCESPFPNQVRLNFKPR